MRFYLNELSFEGLPDDPYLLEKDVRLFVKRCLMMKGLGFKELRSHIYPLNIELAPGKLLNNWVKDRNSGNRELKAKFKNLSLNSPLFHESEADLTAKNDYSNFLFKDQKAYGLGAAYLSDSVVISFATHSNWFPPEIIPVTREFYNVDTSSIDSEDVSVRNISTFKHVINNKQHCLDRSKKFFALDDWKPDDDHLPNVDITNSTFRIQAFYKFFGTLDRQRKLSEAQIMGHKVASLNHYSYDKSLSKLNSTQHHIREIFVSNNLKGKKTYLSIDVEKAAFEVCDFSGTHEREILFDGKENGGQKLDHSIKLKKK